MNRLSPLDPADWPREISGLGDGFAERLNIYRMMAHHPALLRAWAPLREHVVRQSALGEERLEIVILRIAARLGSQYEWAHHVERAAALGMDAARVRSLAGAISTMQAEDGLLAETVDALIDDTKLSGALLARATDLLGDAGVFDLMATVGFYKVLGCIAETYGIETDDLTGQR